MALSWVSALARLLRPDSSLPPADPLDMDPAPGLGGPSDRGWPRGTLIAAWTLAAVGLGAGVALSFDSLCVSLTERPVPRGDLTPILSTSPEPSRDNLTLRYAERLLGQGDLRGAVRVIDTISPEEPSYPLARELRAQAERLLGAREGKE